MLCLDQAIRKNLITSQPHSLVSSVAGGGYFVSSNVFWQT